MAFGDGFGKDLRLGTRLSPEQLEQERGSLVGDLARKGLSGLEAISNILSLPGSSVRDVLAGQNPFDQWASPMASINRTEGRDLLRHYGLVGPTNNYSNWFAGLAADIATDPLIFAGPVGGATKAGQVLKATGLADELGRTLPLAFKSIPPTGTKAPMTEMGSALATKMAHNVDDVITAHSLRETRTGIDNLAENLRKKVVDAAGGEAGYNAIKDQPLAALLNINVPFTSKRLASFGTGEKSQQFANALGKVYDVARHGSIGGVSPGNFLARAWHTPARGAKTKGLQALGNVIKPTVQQRTADRAEDVSFWVRTLDSIEPTSHPGKRLTDLGGEQGEPLRDILERYLYTGDDPQRILTAEPSSEVLEKWGITLTGEDNDKLLGTIRHMQQRLHEQLNQAQKVGLTWKDLRDEFVNYIPRKKVGEHGLSGTRKDWLKGVQGGTEFVRKVAKNEQVRKEVARVGTSTGDADAELATALRGLFPEELAEAPPYVVRGLAHTLIHEPDEVLKAGIYGHHPMYDLQHAFTRNQERIEVAGGLLDFLAEHPDIYRAHATRMPGGRAPHAVRLEDLFKDMGLDPGRSIKRMIQIRQKRAGNYGPLDRHTTKRAKLWEVPGELADDIKRFYRGHDSPSRLPGWDDLTQIWKAAQTAFWPAFHTRNLISGQFANVVAGQFDLKSVGDAYKLVRGETIEGASKIPAVRKRATERLNTLRHEAHARGEVGDLSDPWAGIPQAEQDKFASGVLRDMVYGEGIAGRYEGMEHLNIVDDLKRGDISEIRSNIPGEDPFRQGGKGGMWGKLIGLEPNKRLRDKINPLKQRGVGGAPESDFALARWGEDMSYLVESLNRVTPFINQLRKGVDPRVAADRVAAAQVLYSSKNFTPLESKVLTRIMPFYKYTRGITPFFLRNLWEHPGGLTAQTMHGTRLARSDDPVLPEYLSGTAAIPWPWGGKGDNKRYMTGLGLFFEDPASFAGTDIRDTGLELMSRLHPLPKGMAEYFTGQTFFQRGPAGGRKLEDMDPTYGRIISNLQDRVTGEKTARAQPIFGSPMGEAILSNVLGRPGTTLRQLTDPRKDLFTQAINIGTGFRVSDVSPQARDRYIMDLAHKAMKDIGATGWEKVYFPDDVMEKMGPAERARAEQLERLLEIGAKRDKIRQR